ncbi:MAG: adenylate/guanylate cyclase domain-containing protein [Ardenticatenaceae bacterium]|nr:adenylate/guanylate cyclase domain-containing protein [Anaerolineales bacterium]MCB8923564.1 adenylate/guanylate cyclase domain-containing protein [Ardenticatenaceae bacterium]MCB8991713.1 adenylate/guanylate cyclase domain-containing protein [Ardenticatenaceae bacterium]
MTTAKSNSPTELTALQNRVSELEEELADLQVLLDNTMEHGTALENELLNQTERMAALQSKMRKYLSPQLFQALVGGTADANTKSHKRVKLTIYFSDIVGFTDITDAVEPELLSDVLNSYLTRMSEIALQYGGTIDKFVGDAVMVFFGAPEAMPAREQAERSVRMALEMREALYQLRAEWKRKGITQNLQVRAAINTGICTVGNFGSENRMDYTIIGGQVNLASRLQSAAPPDSIYISSATYSLVEDFADAHFVGPLQVKGIHAPVDVWELTGVTQENRLDSPYLTIDDQHLLLKELDVDMAALSDDERRAIQKALSRVLAHLSTRVDSPKTIH